MNLYYFIVFTGPISWKANKRWSSRVEMETQDVRGPNPWTDQNPFNPWHHWSSPFRAEQSRWQPDNFPSTTQNATSQPTQNSPPIQANTMPLLPPPTPPVLPGFCLQVDTPGAYYLGPESSTT